MGPGGKQGEGFIHDEVLLGKRVGENVSHDSPIRSTSQGKAKWADTACQKSRVREVASPCSVRSECLLFIFYWIYLGWHYLIKLFRFRMYNSITHYLYIILWVHRPKSSLLSSPFIPAPFIISKHTLMLITNIWKIIFKVLIAQDWLFKNFLIKSSNIVSMVYKPDIKSWHNENIITALIQTGAYYCSIYIAKVKEEKGIKRTL